MRVSNKKKQCIVIGLGRFGRSVATQLEANGCMVLAVDADQKKVNQTAPYVTSAMCLDITDEDVADSLGLNNFDIAIISMAHNLENAVLTSVVVKEKGVKTVIAEAYDEIQGKVLDKLGVDRVVFPQQDIGISLANNITFDHFIDSVEIIGDYSIVEVNPPETWVGKTLIDLNLRKKFDINVIAIRRNDEIDVTPKANIPILADDVLVIIGKNDELRKLSKKI